MLRDRGRKGGKRRAVVDQAAAVVILQHALDTERATGTAPGEILEDETMSEPRLPDDVDARARGADATRTRAGRPRAAGGRGLQELPRRAGRARRASSAGSTSPSPRASRSSRPVLLGPEDYPGPGHGTVTFQVKQGDTIADDRAAA